MIKIIDADLCKRRLIFQHFLGSTVDPIGRKKVRTLFFSRKKKEHLAQREDAQISAPARAPSRNEAPWRALMAPWGLFTLYVGSTFG